MRRRWAAQAAQRSHSAPHAVHSPASHLSDSSAAASRTPEAPLAAGPASVSLDSSFQVVEDLASQRSLAPEVVDLTKDSDLHWYFRKAPVPGSPKPLPSDQHSPASKASPPGHRLKLSPHGDLPTVADLARPPTQQHASTLRKSFFPSHASDSPLSPPPPPKRSRSPLALPLGGLRTPPRPARPRSMQAAQIPVPKASSTAAPVQGPALPAIPTPALLPPKPLRVKLNSTRQSAHLRHQACGTAWCQVLHRLNAASRLWVALQPCKDPTEHMLAVLINFRPSTLERYLRTATLFLSFVHSSAFELNEISLALLLDFLAAARASGSQDREIHQMSANSSIKALRWLARHSQWTSLDTALHSPVISAYAGRSTAKDRKEALPVPWCLVAAWEMRVCCSATPVTTALALGAALLCIHASLRFGDVQRIDYSSLSLSSAAVHGICFATKTTSTGQPFAVSVAGLTGRSAQSCWTLHWLSALHGQAQAFGCPNTFDFLWPNSAPELGALPELAPASYCTAMLTMRWAATLPWLPPGQGLLPAEAKQLTLHSLKSTQLPHSSASTKTTGSCKAITGIRLPCTAATTPLLAWMFRQSLAQPWPVAGGPARGGQAPVPEPPFALPPGPVLQSLRASDLLAGAWSHFTTRHEQLQASGGTPAQPVPSDPALTQIDSSPDSPAASPKPVDLEAIMVEQAALAGICSDTSERSSASSVDSDNDQAPLELRMPGSAAKYACSGPWGRWHAVRTDALQGQPRTACGIALGLAAQFSDRPHGLFCKRQACVGIRAARDAR